MEEIWKKKISSFFEKNAKWRVSRDRSFWIVQGSFKDSRVDIYLLRNIFPLFFTAGFIFHSWSFIRKVRVFPEFCASFSFEERQRTVRNYEAKLNPRSLFLDLHHDWSTSFANPREIFLKFHALWSFTARNLSGVEVRYRSCRVSSYYSAYSFRVLIYRSGYFSH